MTNQMTIVRFISMGQQLAASTQCGVTVMIVFAPLLVNILQTVIVIEVISMVAVIVMPPITGHAFNSTHTQNAAAVAVDGPPVVMVAQTRTQTAR